ncbi:dihydroxy-acid dehydratase family protein [Mariniblastus sp.]|jgi:dihydroxy-acid dehydratase|nr:IlvD/Edd family dehydratase [Mariniblastus sp.]MDB4756588.1 dihydroxy-acid dehydratase family protein [Mariniblastus sp.]
MASSEKRKPLRSEQWFNDPEDPGMTAVYVERFFNYGITADELQSGRPVIGIAQIGSDITPCNRIHLQTVERVRDGVRDAGGIPLVFPVHPIQESVRRPTAALDRNLAYMGLVEIIHGYPFDGLVLTTGCDKTTPACLMAAATTNLPSIALSGGPMLDSYHEGKLTGSGVALWEARKLLAAKEIDYTRFMEIVAASTTSQGHCNTMGTALTMNCLAEVLGMSLPGCGAIPAVFRERMQMAYATGQRIVPMVGEDLTPEKILTRKAFENAIVANTALGGSTNAPPHLCAIARHLGIELTVFDWEKLGYDIPLLVNCQPAGHFLGEAFHRSGGVPTVLKELAAGGKIHLDCPTVSGDPIGHALNTAADGDNRVIMRYETPLKTEAGFLVLKGNLFDSALIKTSVINEQFRQKYVNDKGFFVARAIVFDGPEDYHNRINDDALEINEDCLLVIRGAGPVGYPGSAEVVNMQPPDHLIQKGIDTLPTLGDGRQSGTSASPSILNASPESAVGGRLSILETGDKIKIDIQNRQVDLMISQSDIDQRVADYIPPVLTDQTPWQEIYRGCVGQLETGACLDFATKFRNVAADTPRRNH